MYDITNQEELYHYGVKGMKWGVRRNASKAFAKASKKADRMKQKSEKLAAKSNKLMKKSQRFYLTDIGYTIHKNQAYKASKTLKKKERLEKKIAKWENKMKDTFKETKPSDLKPEDLDTGRNYVDMLLRK